MAYSQRIQFESVIKMEKPCSTTHQTLTLPVHKVHSQEKWQYLYILENICNVFFRINLEKFILAHNKTCGFNILSPMGNILPYDFYILVFHVMIHGGPNVCCNFSCVVLIVPETSSCLNCFCFYCFLAM